MSRIQMYTTRWCGYCVRAKALLDGIKNCEVEVSVGVVGRQHERDVGPRGHRVRPLYIKAGLHIPSTSVTRTSRGAGGVVNSKVVRGQRWEAVDLRENVGVAGNRVGTEGINDDDGLATSIKIFRI